MIPYEFLAAIPLLLAIILLIDWRSLYERVFSCVLLTVGFISETFGAKK